MINVANIGKSTISTLYTANSVIPTMNHVGKVSKGLQHMYRAIIFLNNFDIVNPPFLPGMIRATQLLIFTFLDFVEFSILDIDVFIIFAMDSKFF